jgi:DNA-binding response OmpR family regulator
MDHELPILIVEDDESLARGLADQIRGAGYAVQHCATATEAADAVSKTVYGLVILDLLLPDVSGVYVLNKLRTLAPQFRPPVLMVTASNVENLRSVDRTLVKAIVFKPLDFSLFLAYATATYRSPVEPSR